MWRLTEVARFIQPFRGSCSIREFALPADTQDIFGEYLKRPDGATPTDNEEVAEGYDCS